MLTRILLAFIVFVLSGAALTAQTPPPAKESPTVFSFSFDGDGGYLGVQTEEITKENFAKYGLREVRGVGVVKVMDDSPAKAANIQDGDVIMRVNGDEITSARKLTRLIGEISPDHTARLVVSRGGTERELNVTIGKRPTPKFVPGSFNFPGGFEKIEMPGMPDLEKLQRIPSVPGKPGEPFVFAFGNSRQIGVGLTPLTKQLSDHYGVEGGALINNVRENSPAAKANLKAGDIVVEADGKPIKGELDLIRAIAAKKEGEITLVIERDRSRQTVKVTPEAVKGGDHPDRLFDFPGMPNAPGSPGVYRLMRPGTPPAPVPLDRLLIPGRIV